LYEGLGGASLGCGFIKNKRAIGELFQIKLSCFGGTFYIATSVMNFQQLEMLKFNRKRNDEGKCWLECSTIDPFCIQVREVMMCLTIKTKVHEVKEVLGTHSYGFSGL
jgi:hypothetical protein